MLVILILMRVKVWICFGQGKRSMVGDLHNGTPHGEVILLLIVDQGCRK